MEKLKFEQYTSSVQVNMWKIIAVWLNCGQRHRHVFIFFAAVQLHDLQYIPLYSSSSTGGKLPAGLDSSVVRALHRYRRGHGFESRWSLNFFQAFFFTAIINRVFTYHLSCGWVTRKDIYASLSLLLCKPILQEQLNWVSISPHFCLLSTKLKLNLLNMYCTLKNYFLDDTFPYSHHPVGWKCIDDVRRK